MLRDLIMMIIKEWQCLPDLNHMILLLKHLLSISSDFGSSRISIGKKLRANVHLITLCFQAWKSRLKFHFNFDHLLAYLKYNPKRKYNEADNKDIKYQILVSLNILAAGFTHEIFSFTNDNQLKQMELCQLLINLIKHKSKSIYQPASEVYGLLLQYKWKKDKFNKEKVKAKASGGEEELKANATERGEEQQQEASMWVNKLKHLFYNELKQDHLKFLTCYSSIIIHCAEYICDITLINIITGFPINSLYDHYLHAYLQIMLCSCDILTKHYTTVEIRLIIITIIEKILKSGSYHDHKSHQFFLTILMKLIHILTINDLILILNKISLYYQQYQHQLSRAVYYKLIISIYQNWFHSEHKVLNSILYANLLQGLNDPSDTIKQFLLTFWDHESNLSSSPIQRLMNCFDFLYHIEIEQNWLHYCVFLMLTITKDSSDFYRSLTTYSLDAQTSTDQVDHHHPIDIGASSVNNPMTPLFLNSSSSSSQLQANTSSDIIFSQTQTLISMDSSIINEISST